MAWIGGNRYLTLDEQKVNAQLIKDFFINKGWTLNAICGMLGNIQTESTTNPQLWESFDIGNPNAGFGLVQWTPSTVLTNWTSDYMNGDKQCERIQYELENGLQWIPTSSFPMSFTEFTQSTDTPYNLAMVFIANYERPLNPNQPIRGEQAEEWYTYFNGITPTPKRKKMPIWMYPIYRR